MNKSFAAGVAYKNLQNCELCLNSKVQPVSSGKEASRIHDNVISTRQRVQHSSYLKTQKQPERKISSSFETLNTLDDISWKNFFLKIVEKIVQVQNFRVGAHFDGESCDDIFRGLSRKNFIKIS